MVGFVIVHLGTVISVDDFKGAVADGDCRCVVHLRRSGCAVRNRVALKGYRLCNRRCVGALSGRTVSVVIIQEAALAAGLVTVAAFPVLIAALEGLIGFPLTSILLRKEALRLRADYRAGKHAPVKADAAGGGSSTKLPAALQSTVGTLFCGRHCGARCAVCQRPDQRHPQHLRGLPHFRYFAAMGRNLQQGSSVGLERTSKLRENASRFSWRM